MVAKRRNNQIVVVRKPSPKKVVVTRPLPRGRRFARGVRGAARRVRNAATDSDAISDVGRTISSAFRRPPFMMVAMVVAALVLTNTKTSGPIHDFCKNRTDLVCKYVTTNFQKACGFAIFIAAIVDIPPAVRIAAAAGMILWVYLIPEATALAYVLQAALLHAYFRVRTDNARLLLFVIAILGYFGGYIVFAKS